ncbi:lysergyl peptide synthetase 1 [Penicillium samsonianum]|uniref:lysergyl peptide synthetase 1 n=1 Tax=Penicillium samsonianum TaxID=1882272 RepID=UPI002547AF7B|nr:lysergyl peptide synthetase 1 [Penicillium samsonianum]KAJ6123667.1 lysergyl peptide synthetase 1 [Penicillium samsonianum]
MSIREVSDWDDQVNLLNIYGPAECSGPNWSGWELVIGGPTVGRGYINNSAASAAAFITSPPPWLREFRKDTEDTRLYKTGDLVQLSDVGSLRFLGRKDFQVKIADNVWRLVVLRAQSSNCFRWQRQWLSSLWKMEE